METAATDRVGPYLLVTQLGSGAMGRVFLGTDADGRQAAVKMVRSDLAEIPAFRKRFSRELQVAERIHSPRIAEIYNAETEGARPWLATEYVPGPTLQDAIDQGGGFDDARLRALAVAIAQALQVIHAAEVVHRDLKPANVLLGPDGPKVIDFGVARALDASLLTNTGQTLGTPAYMSPEQADGRSVQSASDVFALGSLLVFAATGRLAFGDGAPLAILHRVVNNEPDLSGIAENDDVLRQLIKGCLAKEAENRPTPQQIIDLFGEVGWQPLTGVAWQQPPLGVGLPVTASESADTPTVALAPKRGGKRIAVISVAAAAAVILTGIAVVEGSGGSTGKSATGTPQTGGSLSGSQSAAGSFPSTPGSSSDSGQPSASGKPTSTSNAPVGQVKPGNGGTTPDQGNSVPVTVTVDDGGPNNPSTPPTSSSASQPVSHPTTHKTTSPPPQQPAHNPPGPVSGVGAYIPAWFGEATVDASWNADPGATSYVLHYNIDGGGDQYVTVNGTGSSYMLPAGSTSCIQVQAIGQYGKSTWAPAPALCFNSAGQEVGS
ncbi:serine/threonine protein kinase [Catenulispora rubra]|uniref:serine/threonine protein kinase n=1 Tax=Catenulispora rubra TaxID=280293 RepID=UPI0018923B97|nr:serine/threonine-protein kinase [Catenulispora rubra]